MMGVETQGETAAAQHVRTAGWMGMVGAMAFPVLVLIAASRFPGYSHIGQKISELGGDEAVAPRIQNLNFWLLGVGALAIARGLWQVDRRAAIGSALLAAFGVLAAWMNAVFACDAACAGETTSGLVHNVTGAAGFVAVTVAMFLLPAVWDELPGWESLGRITRRLRLVTVVGFGWFVGTQALDAPALSGLAQRVFAGSVIVWLALTGWTLVTRPVPRT